VLFGVVHGMIGLVGWEVREAGVALSFLSFCFFAFFFNPLHLLLLP
jgi:hypothetical protein